MASPPGGEQRALRERVAALEADLGAYREQLGRAQRRVCRTERLYREAREDNEALRRQVGPLPGTGSTGTVRPPPQLCQLSPPLSPAHRTPLSPPYPAERSGRASAGMGRRGPGPRSLRGAPGCETPASGESAAGSSSLSRVNVQRLARQVVVVEGRSVTSSLPESWLCSQKEKLPLAERKKLKRGEVKKVWKNCPVDADGKLEEFFKCHSLSPQDSACCFKSNSSGLAP